MLRDSLGLTDVGAKNFRRGVFFCTLANLVLMAPIGILFLLYGYYRAVNQPGMSVILTIASLGTRVALAYLLSATPLGVTGIWLSVPIGWALADAIGIGYYFKNKKTKAAA